MQPGNEWRVETMFTHLDKIPEHQNAKVINIEGGERLKKRLGQMGIHPGDVIAVLRYGALKGPILCEIHGFQVALGRGIASKILVEENE
ncbi:MAG: FeoA family protein [Deltaproteobacteria bacterium]|nr:FeoA family protein [Deltaproteobacteria bacterium]